MWDVTQLLWDPYGPPETLTIPPRTPMAHRGPPTPPAKPPNPTDPLWPHGTPVPWDQPLLQWDSPMPKAACIPHVPMSCLCCPRSCPPPGPVLAAQCSLLCRCHSNWDRSARPELSTAWGKAPQLCRDHHPRGCGCVRGALGLYPWGTGGCIQGALRVYLWGTGGCVHGVLWDVSMRCWGVYIHGMLGSVSMRCCGLHPWGVG